MIDYSRNADCQRGNEWCLRSSHHKHGVLGGCDKTCPCRDERIAKALGVAS